MLDAHRLDLVHKLGAEDPIPVAQQMVLLGSAGIAYAAER